MKAFIIKPSYYVSSEKTYIEIYGRLENGESFHYSTEFKPYFFIETKDVTTAKNIETEIKFTTEKSELLNFSDNKLSKIILNNNGNLKTLRRELFEYGITSFESDIKPQFRYLMDRNIFGICDIKGEYAIGEKVNREYKPDAVITSYKESQKLGTNIKPVVFSFDIETNRTAEQLFSISVVCGDFKRAILVKDTAEEFKNTTVCSTEKEALIEFKKLIHSLDPDIITGWNVIDFDLAFMYRKYKTYKIPFDIGRNKKEASIRIETDFFTNSYANIPGRIVLDGIKLLKDSFIILPDYKLDTAASEIVGRKKLITGDVNKVQVIEDNYNFEPQKLIDYNIEDSVLVLEILKKKDLINMTIARSMLVGMPMDKVSASIASLDYLYITELRKIGYVANTTHISIKDKGISGAYIKEPIPGIYNGVIVCDFKSLYPSIMRTFNIDPLSFFRAQKDCNSDGIITAPNGAKFDSREGLLPSILKRLWESRDEMKKEKNDAGSYAIKIHMNSLYGVLANPTCRFYSYDMADAITSFAREIIQMAEKMTEEFGYTVLYGDTDSIFIDVRTDDISEMKKKGESISKKINDFFDDYIKKKYNRESKLEIEYEKTYRVLMFPAARGGNGAGAKKRYAGMLVDSEGNEKMDFKGLEFVRRDWTLLAKDFQLGLLNLVFNKKDYKNFIKDFVAEVNDGKKDSLLVYKKSLRKGTEEYTATTPPHVKAARKLEDAGLLNSTLIEYYITQNGPEPKELLKNKIDYDHYIEKQIKPIADSVLAFDETNFDDLMQDTKQQSLFDY